MRVPGEQRGAPRAHVHGRRENTGSRAREGWAAGQRTGWAARTAFLTVASQAAEEPDRDTGGRSRRETARTAPAGGRAQAGALRGLSPGPGGGRAPRKDDPAALPAGLSSPPRLQAALPPGRAAERGGEVGPQGPPPPRPPGCVRIPLRPPPQTAPPPYPGRVNAPWGNRRLPRPHPPLQDSAVRWPLFLLERWLIQPLNIKSGH